MLEEMSRGKLFVFRIVLTQTSAMFRLIPWILCTLVITQAEINVVIWDEQQPRQKQAYENFLGNAIADHLRPLPGISVKTVTLDSPGKGIGPAVLNSCDVLLWWGHVRQAEITPEECKPIIERIKAGKMSFIPLHSAHWSTPFMEAMNERTRMHAAKRYPRTQDSPNVAIEFVPPPGRVPPTADSMVTPAYLALKRGGVATTVRVDLPNCCFPGWRNDGEPSSLESLLPDHPIAQGLPKYWSISSTEMYAEPFHVPEPDQVVFKETFSKGEWFRSGCVWELGKGKVFYFRPGHETFPIFKEKLPLKVIENAVRWLATDLQNP
ncbi:MAG: ThuA domain-containing protein [Verrucomicrobia bacterium]|nr:ThuA domain-containing protein [Verrucomicrobiota bacterium]